METISLAVNGQPITAQVDPRLLLVDFLRDRLGLTGTHVGCTTSQCGTCVVLVDGRSVKACTMLVVQADGAEITTIEGLAVDGVLHPIQAAFRDHHALQCGYCTPGMVMSACDLLAHNPDPDEAQIRTWLEGNLCRCTGYGTIIEAIKAAAKVLGKTAPTVNPPHISGRGHTLGLWARGRRDTGRKAGDEYQG